METEKKTLINLVIELKAWESADNFDEVSKEILQANFEKIREYMTKELEKEILTYLKNNI